MKPKPLSCTVDRNGVKHSSFDEREMREYLATTTDTTLLVTTEEGVEFVIVLESLRRTLRGG